MTHLAVLLYSGNYLEAAQRRDEGLADRYRHHTYALESLESLARSGVRVSVVQLRSEQPYDEVAGHGIRYLGLGAGEVDQKVDAVSSYVVEEGVTHAMLRTPSAELVRALTATPARVSLTLADSFPRRWRHRRAHAALARALAHPRVDFVANHHLASARHLADVLGLDRRRVLPWDWPLDLVDVAREPVPSRAEREDLRIFYAGSLMPSKGVWDLVSAVRLLRREGLEASLDVAGGGDEAGLRAHADSLGVAEHVRVLGRLGGDEVVAMMRSAAFVCVPSRHDYPEGLPLTIFEALASGTPLVASDHPMFAEVLRPGSNALVFPAGRPRRLAAAVRLGWRDEATYDALSRQGRADYPGLGEAPLWGDLLHRWVHSPAGETDWVNTLSLAARSGIVTDC